MADEKRGELNLTELLLQIREDVAVIKTDMANFKDSYKNEKVSLLSKIDDVRKDYEKDVKDLKDKVDRLETEVRDLKTAEDKRDAKHWRTTVAFILTGLGGILLSRIPDFILYLMKLSMASGGN